MPSQNKFAPFSKPRFTSAAAFTSALILLGGCNKATEVAGNALDARRSVAAGKGGSIVSGSVGPVGADGAVKQLLKCERPVAMVAVNENPRGYAYARSGKYPNLPESPVPLVRLMLQ